MTVLSFVTKWEEQKPLLPFAFRYQPGVPGVPGVCVCVLLLRIEMDEMQKQAFRSLPLGLETDILKVMTKYGKGFQAYI